MATGLGDQGQVRRHGAAVRGPGHLVIGKRRRERIRRHTGAFDRIAIIIEFVIAPDARIALRDLHHDRIVIRVRECLGLEGTAPLAQIAETHQVHRVTGRTDFLVNLVATLQRLPVIGSERTIMMPVVLVRRVLLALEGGSRAGETKGRDGGGENAGHLHDRRSPQAFAVPRTAASIEAGRSLGFSMMPNTGRTTMK